MRIFGVYIESQTCRETILSLPTSDSETVKSIRYLSSLNKTISISIKNIFRKDRLAYIWADDRNEYKRILKIGIYFRNKKVIIIIYT